MWVKRYTPLISSRLAIIWTSQPCKPSATNLLQCPLCTLSPFPPTRQSSSPKSSLRPTRTFLMCSHEKRLRTCPRIASLIMKFTSTPPHSHIYPLSGTELCLLHEFLDDMLGKGFI